MGSTSEAWVSDWQIELPGRPSIAIAAEDKDEWLNHLFAFMREEFDYGYSTLGTRHLNTGQRVHAYKLNTSDGRDLPRLLIIDEEDGLRLVLAGTGDTNAEEVDVWIRGADAATGRLGNRGEVDWMAIVCQQPSAIELSGGRLTAPAVVGGLRIDPLDVCVREASSYTMTDVGVMTTSFAHWPIQISGTVQCYAWKSDGEWQTIRRLRTITALLSLAWNAPWKLREGPRDPKASFADSRGPLLGDLWQPLSDGNPLGNGRRIEVPSWLAEAESAVAATSRLASAVLMHHEGLLLRMDHSSMALVCFVSAIESAAQVTKKPDKCKECGMILSSRARFDEAVRSVLPSDMATWLIDAYPKRSKTVHQGTLHGVELQLNSFGRMSLFLPDEQSNFSMGVVKAAQEASRLLLLRLLKVEG